MGPQDPELKNLWQATSNHRRNLGTVDEYFLFYPILGSSMGISLLCLDFEARKWVTDPHVFLKTWNNVAQKILAFAKTKNIGQELLIEQAIPATLELLTLLYLFRTNRIPTKPGTRWRHSQVEVAESFVMQIENSGELDSQLEKRRTKLLKYGLTLQPFVVIIGSKTSFSSVLVIVNDAKYECSNLMAAVDCCFKITWALSTKYQMESEIIWKFLEKYVYDIKSDEVSDKIFLSVDALWSDNQT
ncbi:uncharacterized protein [Venturia canescens]|uniref:uncharacterized protein isoform X1 n=1 Tax=Venturia canescens TaxID=32260 RepID=UPI001C9BE364|nr:uncharacterized protein LOC122415918 isoform X1 [Venturia canescens]